MKLHFLLSLGMMISCHLMAQVGTFIDPRDKKTYETIKIGNQIWFSENLKFKPEGVVLPKAEQEEYGFLYNWEVAQKACPAGWQLPNEDDWKLLISALGGKYGAGGKMKSNSVNWKTPNKINAALSGFDAEPAGMISAGQVKLLNESALYWSSEAECTSGNSVILNYNANFVDKKIFPKTDLLAIRCIKKP
jgi:uncharacterized protein (TIGR02145 family)